MMLENLMAAKGLAKMQERNQSILQPNRGIRVHPARFSPHDVAGRHKSINRHGQQRACRTEFVKIFRGHLLGAR
eukprot:8919286-Pyramimonas_sp.AAC.1